MNFDLKNAIFPFDSVRYLTAPGFSILFKGSLEVEYYKTSKLYSRGSFITEVVPFHSNDFILNSLVREQILLATGYRLEYFQTQLKYDYELPRLEDQSTLVYFVTHLDRFNTFPHYQHKLNL